MGLVRRTPLEALLASMFGCDVFPIRGAQIATQFPADDALATNEAGWLSRDTPHNGWVGHIDGVWNGGIPAPSVSQRFSAEEEARWYTDPGTNGVPRQAGKGTHVTNFTALIGVALSDQRADGAGQLGLLRGGHRHMEAFFRRQRAAGGPLGPGGPGWPRENFDAPNSRGLVHYPDDVRHRCARGAVTGADGTMWPKPTLLKLRPGDAFIVHFSTPHSVTRVLTSEPRLIVYFRCIPSNRTPDNFMAYPNALCDNWLEWEGIRALTEG
jgi:hypothetical protein